jgi:hypothetical protein
VIPEFTTAAICLSSRLNPQITILMSSGIELCGIENLRAGILLALSSYSL